MGEEERQPGRITLTKASTFRPSRPSVPSPYVRSDMSSFMGGEQSWMDEWIQSPPLVRHMLLLD